MESDWLLGWSKDDGPPSVVPPGRPAGRASNAPRRAPEQATAAAGERQRVRVLDPVSEEATSNISDMQLMFFGTSAGQPTSGRRGQPLPLTTPPILPAPIAGTSCNRGSDPALPLLCITPLHCRPRQALAA
jgi:hypothetical protein